MAYPDSRPRLVSPRARPEHGKACPDGIPVVGNQDCGAADDHLARLITGMPTLVLWMIRLTITPGRVNVNEKTTAMRRLW